ncbi:MAG: hypothetical protein H0V01_03915 [Bacteroidetes bacterium]|nr:hypothetical protein [Bacteroidota bacterium]HET6243545.1 hypothetical protein [Bacteroidia bacterium]
MLSRQSVTTEDEYIGKVVEIPDGNFYMAGGTGKYGNGKYSYDIKHDGNPYNFWSIISMAFSFLFP